MDILKPIEKFIADFHYELSIALIILVVSLILFLFIWGVLTTAKKRKLLHNIDKSVEEINNKFGQLSEALNKPTEVKLTKDREEKKRDIIYIDNRHMNGNKEEDNIIKNIKEIVDDELTVEERNEALFEETKSEVRSKKIETRDCDTGKNGRTYTLDELKNQIKE